MTAYQDWLKDFLSGKEEVTTFPDSGSYAVHTIHRYIDKKTNCLWETALTYTGRLVVRSGKIDHDGIKVSWSEWETKHDVKVD